MALQVDSSRRQRRLGAQEAQRGYFVYREEIDEQIDKLTAEDAKRQEAIQKDYEDYCRDLQRQADEELLRQERQQERDYLDYWFPDGY